MTGHQIILSKLVLEIVLLKISWKCEWTSHFFSICYEEAAYLNIAVVLIAVTQNPTVKQVN